MRIILIIVALLASASSFAECQGKAIQRQLTLKVDNRVVETDARIELCQLVGKQQQQMQQFIEGVNANHFGTAARFFIGDRAKSRFNELRASYEPVYQKKAQLVYKDAFQLDNRAFLVFGHTQNSDYLNYFTFNVSGKQLFYADKASQRDNLAWMIANAKAVKTTSVDSQLTLVLAESPSANLKINGSSCIDACADEPEVVLLQQLKQAVEDGQFNQLSASFASRSKAKLDGWINRIPKAERMAVLEQHFFPQHLIYRFDLGNVVILGYVKSDKQLERLQKGITVDIQPHHIYFVKASGSYKVANFYQETLIDDYLKEHLVDLLFKRRG